MTDLHTNSRRPVGDLTRSWEEERARRARCCETCRYHDAEAWADERERRGVGPCKGCSQGADAWTNWRTP